MVSFTLEVPSEGVSQQKGTQQTHQPRRSGLFWSAGILLPDVTLLVLEAVGCVTTKLRNVHDFVFVRSRVGTDPSRQSTTQPFAQRMGLFYFQHLFNFFSPPPVPKGAGGSTWPRSDPCGPGAGSAFTRRCLHSPENRSHHLRVGVDFLSLKVSHQHHHQLFAWSLPCLARTQRIRGTGVV